jgi:hypothetical protein
MYGRIGKHDMARAGKGQDKDGIDKTAVALLDGEGP